MEEVLLSPVAMLRRNFLRAAGVIALAFTPLVLPSLVQAIPAEERLANLSIRRWGPESGLPEETFADVLAPGDGYVWLASNHGLVRFDGQRAEVFRLGDAFGKKSTGNCSSSTLSALLRGSDGTIWAGSSGGCLFRLLQDRFGSFANFQLAGLDAPGTDREANGVMALRQPHSGSGIEVSRRSRIALLRQPATDMLGSRDATGLTPKPSGEQPLLSAPQGLQITLSTRDQNGGLWAIMNDRKLYHAPRSATDWNFKFASPATPRRLLVDRDGFVWIATTKGLYRWRDGKTQHWGRNQGLPHDEVLNMRQDRAGCIWMSLAFSVARLCGDRLESIAVGKEDEEVLAAIDEDPQGNVWIGGRWGNLYRISPRHSRIFTRDEGLPESHLTGVTVDLQGQVWGSLRSSGLARITDGRVVETYNSPSIAETQTLLPHPGQGVIAAGTAGLFVVDQRGIRPLPLQSPISFRSLPALFAPSPVQILYSNSTANYRLRRQPHSAESWAVDTLTGPARLRQFIRDANHRIWALAQYEGLHWLDGDVYRRADNAPATRARAWYSITVDQAGLLWIGTTSGLEIYSPHEKRFLNSAALLPSDQVFHISLDPFGKIWCATRLGLVRFSRQQALAAASASSPLLVERFGEAQSLPTTNFGLVTSATGATDQQGRVWFPGLRGLVSVNPADFERVPRPPAAFLLRVTNDGTPQNLNAAQTIPPNSKKLEFVFQTVRLDPLGGDFCRLQLQGFDPDWLPCNERRTAQYTSLPPGQYEFVLQSSSQAGQWNGQPLRMPITIDPAYHQITWVRSLSILFLASVLGTIAWRRHRQSQQRTRLLEEKVEERTVKLESAMQAAQAANRAKSEFLATMSHEIRTPMNGVLGAVQLLGSSSLTPDQRHLVTVIQQSGEDLVGIVDDILNLSKVEAGLLTLEKSTVHLPTLCENLVSLFAAKAEAKGVAVRLLLAESVPPYILSDPQRLRQILLNLVGNAVKFTDFGEVRLRVTADLPAATLAFHIEDTGPGIPADKLPSLFDPFVQADSSTTRRFGGSGLGLSIVRRFIEAMHGSITVESELGLGSTFLATLPLELAPTPDEPPQPDPSAVPPPETGRTVLLAEDNAVNQLIFQKMLRRLGYLVLTANQGHEALAVLRTEPVDLVLMDCQMPELDGYETTRELRTWGGRFAELPVIALTASAMDEDRQRCMAAGMNDFLSKPVILATLAATLSRWSQPTEPQLR